MKLPSNGMLKCMINAVSWQLDSLRVLSYADSTKPKTGTRVAYRIASMSRLQACQNTRIYSTRGCPGNEKFANTTAHSFPARPERNGRCLVFTLVRECWIAR